jgi:hypothetical protein
MDDCLFHCSYRLPPFVVGTVLKGTVCVINEKHATVTVNY